MPQLIASVEGVVINHVYLHNPRTTLGRKLHNHIVLADQAVSGEHCVFEQTGLSEVYVEDMGSTNGTYINGHMVQRHRLQDGDLITIGGVKLQYLSANELTDEGRTAGMPLQPLQTHPAAALHASLKVLSGTSAGLVVPVVKAVATFGKPGQSLVAIAHRRQGYFVSCMDGAIAPTLNGLPLTDDPVLLQDHDVLELAGTAMEFSLR